jgi:hypothetical protein
VTGPRHRAPTTRARVFDAIGHVGTAVTLASVLVVAAALGGLPGVDDARPTVTATLER